MRFTLASAGIGIPVSMLLETYQLKETRVESLGLILLNTPYDAAKLCISTYS